MLAVYTDSTLTYQIMRTKLTESPFNINRINPSVFVIHGPDPYQNTRSALANIDLSPAKGKKILLKPNAGRIASPGQGVTTDPRVVAAAMDAFIEAGAIVAVGDSPITGVKSLDALEATGISAAAREHNCRILDLDEAPATEVSVPDGTAIAKLKICRDILEYDIIVSIPVMKIHMHTGVTLSIKNMKGCLWRRSKVELHMLPAHESSADKSLDIAIADLASILCPHLSIIDGTVGMEGMGPSAGTPKKLDAIVVSADPFAADAVACRLMGINALSIPHLRIGAARMLGVLDIDKLCVTPENWQDFASLFEPAPKNLSIEFPNVNVLDNNSCSACQSSLLLFLRNHGEELAEYIPKGEVLNIAIGKGHESVPPGTLCIGNCTARFRDREAFVSGCPPVSSEIWIAAKKMRE